MQNLLPIILSMIWGIGSGVVIAGGIIAFITIIGIVPLMSHRTQTIHHSIFYGSAVMLGVFCGNILYIWKMQILAGKLVMALMGFGFGAFVGVLIIALAEVLDVFPITDRRIKIKKGVGLLIISLALGKLVGCLYYWLYPIVTKLE